MHYPIFESLDQPYLFIATQRMLAQLRSSALRLVRTYIPTVGERHEWDGVFPVHNRDFLGY